MKKIIEKANKLLEKERLYLRLIESKADKNIEEIITTITHAITIEEELKLLLAEEDPTNLTIQNEEIKNTVKSVIEGKRLKSIEAYVILTEQINSSSKKTKLEIPDFLTDNWDNLFETFHAQFDLISYFQRKLLLGPLITEFSVPPDLKNIFFELKEAYASGLDKTCIALCRMVIENSFSDVLIKNVKYQDTLHLTRSAKTKPKFEFGLFENINIAEALKIIPKEIAAKSHEVRVKGNKVIHSDRVENIDTLKIIKKTIEILERLYRQT